MISKQEHVLILGKQLRALSTHMIVLKLLSSRADCCWDMRCMTDFNTSSPWMKSGQRDSIVCRMNDSNWRNKPPSLEPPESAMEIDRAPTNQDQDDHHHVFWKDHSLPWAYGHNARGDASMGLRSPDSSSHSSSLRTSFSYSFPLLLSLTPSKMRTNHSLAGAASRLCKDWQEEEEGRTRPASRNITSCSPWLIRSLTSLLIY